MAWIDRHGRLRSRWRWLRRRLGNDDLFIILLAVVTGTVAGLGVIALRGLVVGLHTLLYGVPLHEHSLLQADIPWQRILAVLGAGGLVYGLVTLLIQRWQRREPFDAIEANALHGGVMSMRD